MIRKYSTSLSVLAFMACSVCLMLAMPDAHAAVPGLIGGGLQPLVMAAAGMFGGAGYALREPFQRRSGGGSGGGGGTEEVDPEKALGDAKKELERISTEIKSWREGADKQLKESGELTKETKGAVDKLLVEQTSALDAFHKRLADLEQKAVRRPGAGDPEAPKSAGAMLIADEKVQAFCKNVTQGQVVKVGMKSIVVSGDVPANIIAPMRAPGIAPLPLQQLRLRDLISVGRTSSPSYWYVQESGFTNHAEVVTENTRKPTSVIDLVLKQANVATIAHIFKAAKQLLDDLPALQSLVDTKLRYGLALTEEAQILYGDGTGLNMHGIIPQAADYNPAFTPDALQPIDQLMLAITQVTLALYSATGIVMHPIDWARIVLQKDTQGRYLWANPVGVNGPTMWGLPVVPSMSIVQGTFLVGAFKQGALLLDREDANVQIATQNEDDFVKNMITLRAEERAALAVERPEAFVTGEFVT